MQIKFIISNHSIRETTLCATQTYGATSGGQHCLCEAVGVGDWKGRWVEGRVADHGLGWTGDTGAAQWVNLRCSAADPLSSTWEAWQGSMAQFTLLSLAMSQVTACVTSAWLKAVATPIGVSSSRSKGPGPKLASADSQIIHFSLMGVHL